MGTFVLRLKQARERAERHDRILGRLRRLRARLTGSRLEGRGKAATEVYEFTTTGIPAPKARRLSPLWISPTDVQRRRVEGLVAAIAVGRAVAGRQFTQKEVTMTRPLKVRELRLGKHEPEARRIYELARRLVRGEGPPDELRMENPPVTVLPHATKEPSKNAWGVAGIGVALEMHRPYPPIEALVIGGYILFGIDWPERYRALRLPASLEAAYRALEAHFAREDRPALVAIPKERRRLPTRKESPKVIEESRDSHAALPPPERLQLTDRSKK